MTTNKILFAFLVLMAVADHAVANDPAVVREPYRVQPGDVLTVSVWKEEGLTGDVVVRPDGGLSFPLAGDISASGKSVEDLRKEITERLKHYMPQPVVTVAVKQIGGNHVYVLGKVNKPGDFQFTTPIDVMQALSLAGGATPYAAPVSYTHLERIPAVLTQSLQHLRAQHLERMSGRTAGIGRHNAIGSQHRWLGLGHTGV